MSASKCTKPGCNAAQFKDSLCVDHLREQKAGSSVEVKHSHLNTFGKAKVGIEEKCDGINSEFLTGGKYEVTQERLDELKTKFLEMDEDASGAIDLQELGRAMERLGKPKNQIELRKMIAEVDDDKDGQISYREFLVMMLGKKSSVLALILKFEGLAKQNAGPILPKTNKPPPGKINVGAAFQANAASASAAPAQAHAEKKAPGKLAIGKGPALHLGQPKSMHEIMFEKFDGDNSGYIDPTEFQLLCRNLGYAVSAAELALALKTIDSDGSGQISKDEFAKWWGRADRWSELHMDEKQLEIRQRASEAFKTFDHSNKGVITSADYDAFYDALIQQKLTTKDKTSCFADLDGNGDGSISFAEYVEWLARIGSISVKVIIEDPSNFPKLGKKK